MGCIWCNCIINTFSCCIITSKEYVAFHRINLCRQQDLAIASSRVPFSLIVYAFVIIWYSLELFFFFWCTFHEERLVAKKIKDAGVLSENDNGDVSDREREENERKQIALVQEYEQRAIQTAQSPAVVSRPTARGRGDRVLIGNEARRRGASIGRGRVSISCICKST